MAQNPIPTGSDANVDAFQVATTQGGRLPFPMRLSQGQLNVLAACPRKFQHMFLEQLGLLNPLEEHERLRQGNRFHLLLQQWNLGLPVDPLVQDDPQLQSWFDAFLAAAPDILAIAGDTPSRQSEHVRTLAFQGYLLTVVYDLLIATGQQAQILDWKTYSRPRSSRWLAQDWQTRLYLFVLAETSAYLPEQLAMTYWFFPSSGEQSAVPQSYRFTYDAAKHAQTRSDLTALLTQLTHWLTEYEAGVPLPLLPPNARECEQCSFVSRCFGAVSSIEVGSGDRSLDGSHRSLPDLAEIQEVPL